MWKSSFSSRSVFKNGQEVFHLQQMKAPQTDEVRCADRFSVTALGVPEANHFSLISHKHFPVSGPHL